MADPPLPRGDEQARAATTSRRVAALTVGVAGLALAAHLALLEALPVGSGGWFAWLGLVVAFAAAEATTAHFQLGRQSVTYSLSEVPFVVGLALVDPVAVLTARLLGAGAVIVVNRHGRHLKLAFNLASMWLETVVGVAAWTFVLGGTAVGVDAVAGSGAGAAGAGPALWGAALALVVATDLCSLATVTAAMRLSGGHLDRSALPELTVGSLMAVANGGLGIVVLAVVASDWRAVWALVLVGAVLTAAYRSHSRLRRRHDSLERLAELTRDLEGGRGADEVVAGVVARVSELLVAEVVELTWRPDDGPPLSATGGAGTATRVHPSAAAPRAAALGVAASRAAAFGVAADHLLAPRGTRDAAVRDALSRADLRDAVVVALRHDDEVCGTLLVGDRLGDTATFTVEDLRVLQALASHAAVALANGQLTDRLLTTAAQREHEALHDWLTGLPNRRLFRQRCQEALASGEPMAVLLLDLDRFKEVNDTLGHPIGDQVLQAVADRLRAALPDESAAARLGGDEFAVVVPAADPTAAAAEAERLRAALSRRWPLGDLVIAVDTSVGVALAPRDGTDPDTLLQRADVAMYAAKRDGTGVALYASDRDHYSPRRLALVNDLRDAVGDGSLQVWFQPTIDLATGAALGAEALVRWQHPHYGLIPPDDFLPIAEHTDLMLPLTITVLGQALRQCAEWEAAGMPLRVAVNLSPRVLLAPELPSVVTTLLATTGLPPERLTLEITEGSIIADPVRGAAVLECFAALGVRLSIDDFGTGYSSLSYLRRLPVQELKIDKSFVFELAKGGSDAVIVDATVDLAHRLGLEVVAEGVETPAVRDALARMGCDVGQGYLFSRPLPPGEATSWLQAWAASTPRPEPLSLPERRLGAA